MCAILEMSNVVVHFDLPVTLHAFANACAAFHPVLLQCGRSRPVYNSCFQHGFSGILISTDMLHVTRCA